MTLKIGDDAINFNLIGIDDNNYSLDNFKDKKLIAVIFTCNHCPYAQAYEDRIKQLQEDFKNKLQIIAINSNESENYPEDSFDNMKIKHEESNFNFPYLRDKSQEIARKYGAGVTPDVFLFNENRKLVYRGRIDDNWEYEEEVKEQSLRNAVTELLEGKEVNKKEARAIGCSIKWK